MRLRREVHPVFERLRKVPTHVAGLPNICRDRSGAPSHIPGRPTSRPMRTRASLLRSLPGQRCKRYRVRGGGPRQEWPAKVRREDAPAARSVSDKPLDPRAVVRRDCTFVSHAILDDH
jgi:hypothetical protein